MARMKDTDSPPFVSVALVDTDKPPNDGVHEDERPTGRENLAKAREVSGLGEDVCFLNTYNPNQGKNPRDGMDAADRSDGFDTSGLEEAMAKVEADVVAVITPPDTHAPCALAAVRAGKHIMVEKPFCKTLKDAVQIVEEAEKAGVKVMVLQNDRYRSGADEIHQLVKSGKIGQPYFGMMTRYGNRANPHHSGEDDHSYLWERGIHDFDSIVHLFDSKPKRIFADSFNPPWSGYKGGAGVNAWIEFESGARCCFLVTFMNQRTASEPNSPSSIPSQGLRIEFQFGTAEYVGDLSKTPWITESRHVSGGGWLLHTGDNEEPELVAKLTEDPRSILAFEGQSGASAAPEEILLADFYKCAQPPDAGPSPLSNCVRNCA